MQKRRLECLANGGGLDTRPLRQASIPGSLINQIKQQMNIDQNRARVGQPVDKVWGKTRCVKRGHGFEVHYLEINPDAYCSRHKHQSKWNQFTILEGKLGVRYYDDAGRESAYHSLRAGEVLLVPPGQIHRFESREHCKAIETYWTDPVDPDDIQRMDEGGVFVPDEYANAVATE